MGFKTQPGTALRSHFPKPQESKGPPDLKRVREKPEKPKNRELKRREDALRFSFGHVLQKPREPAAGAVMKFILPLSPIGQNLHMHWADKKVLHDQYRAHFEELRLRRLLPPLPESPLPRVRVRATFFTKGKNDLDNLFGRVKISIDCIVVGGWVLDDNPDCLTWDAIPKQVVSPRKNAYLVLEIWADEEGQ